MKGQVNARVSEATRKKLDELTAVYGTQAEVLAVAIDQLYIITFGKRSAFDPEATKCLAYSGD